MSDDDEWVELALMDDSVVADFLIRLSKTKIHHPLSETQPGVAQALHVDWTVRQPRTKFVPRHGASTKKSDSTRASPTTPLTWSGATSVSGGVADGLEDSSQMTTTMTKTKTSDGARSKIEKNQTTMKRPRKKKTLAELKDEESLLLKERRSLKDALASLRLAVEKQRGINGTLKKMKLDIELQQTIETAVTSAAVNKTSPDQPQLPTARANMAVTVIDSDNADDISYHYNAPNISCKLREIGTLGSIRLLPDLNLPFQEDTGSEVLYGM